MTDKDDPRAVERRAARNSPKSPFAAPYERDPMHTYIEDEESGKELIRAIIDDPIAPAVPHVRLHTPAAWKNEAEDIVVSVRKKIKAVYVSGMGKEEFAEKHVDSALDIALMELLYGDMKSKDKAANAIKVEEAILKKYEAEEKRIQHLEKMELAQAKTLSKALNVIDAQIAEYNKENDVE
jgi:hypothetical protein